MLQTLRMGTDTRFPKRLMVPVWSSAGIRKYSPALPTRPRMPAFTASSRAPSGLKHTKASSTHSPMQASPATMPVETGFSYSVCTLGGVFRFAAFLGGFFLDVFPAGAFRLVSVTIFSA